MKKVMPNLYPPNGPCHVSFGTPYAAGSYAMLNVSLDKCLQTYSDDVVLGTNSLSQPNQTVPSWVHSLPEPQRSIKTALVKQFGSPNVFSQFQVRRRSPLKKALCATCMYVFVCQPQYFSSLRR